MHGDFQTIINPSPFSLAGLSAGSNSSSSSLMSSITRMPSSLSTGTISSNQYGAALSPSPASGVRSSSQILVAVSSSQTDSSLPSNLRSVAPSSSPSRITLSSSQLLVAPFTTMTTLHETVQTLFEGAISNAVEAFQILNSSIPFHGTISRTYHINSATDSTLVETNIPSLMGDQTLSLFLTHSKSPFHKSVSLSSEIMAATAGQASQNLPSTSSLTSDNSQTSVISPTTFKLHQSADISYVVPPMNGNSFQGTVGLSTKTSASLQSLLSVTGDRPLTRITSLTISRSSTIEKSILSNVSMESSLVMDTPISPLNIAILNQEAKQDTKYISLHSFANIPSQTHLTGVASHATDSTQYSTSTASISNIHHRELSSSSDSWNYHLHSNSKSSSSDAYSSTSVDYKYTDPHGFQSVPIWNRSTIAFISFSGKTALISDKVSSLSKASGITFTKC